MNNRRSELEIINKILDISKEGAKKTDILYYGNLNYRQLKNYLSFLLGNQILEIIEIEKNGNSCSLYKPTEKGHLFHKDVRKVLSHLS